MESEQSSSGTGRKALKFDSGPRTTLALAQKSNSLAATVRYEDEKAISDGDEIDVLSAHTGEQIGTASVEHTETVAVQRAIDVIRGRWAEYGIQQPDVLESRLNEYYDDPICRLTEVKVIILDPALDSTEPAPSTDGGRRE